MYYYEFQLLLDKRLSFWVPAGFQLGSCWRQIEDYYFTFQLGSSLCQIEMYYFEFQLLLDKRLSSWVPAGFQLGSSWCQIGDYYFGFQLGSS